jgi:hypothetical protein
VLLLGVDGQPVGEVPPSTPLTLRVRVRASEVVEVCSLGMTVTRGDGTHLYELHTTWQGVAVGPLAVGQEATIDVRFSAHLLAGHYTIATSVTDVTGRETWAVVADAVRFAIEPAPGGAGSSTWRRPPRSSRGRRVGSASRASPARSPCRACSAGGTPRRERAVSAGRGDRRGLAVGGRPAGVPRQPRRAGPRRLEVVVVDNASTDGTADVLATAAAARARHPLRVRTNATNRGFAGGVNDALALLDPRSRSSCWSTPTPAWRPTSSAGEPRRCSPTRAGAASSRRSDAPCPRPTADRCWTRPGTS